MNSKKTCFLLFLVAFSLVVDNAEADGWKFWKKKKPEEPTSTTVAPSILGGTSATNSGGVTGDTRGIPASGPAQPVVNNVQSGNNGNAVSNPGSPSIGTRGAIAGAGTPGLAVGVANSGPNIRANAQPQRPNPGTEVGLDIAPARPAKPGTGPTSGQNYRDWAVDLTGAGEGTRPAAKLPAQGPALGDNGRTGPGNAGQRITPGSAPGSPVPSPNAQPAGSNGRQPPPINGPRPGSPSSPQPGSPSSQPGSPQPGFPSSSRPASPSSPQPGSPSSSRPGSPSGVPAAGSKPLPAASPVNPQSSGPSGGSQTSTLHVGSLNPGKNQPGTPSSGYVSPGSSVSGGSPTPGGKSWAEVAGNGGNAKPSSPTPAPRPSGSVQPGRTAGSPGQALGTGAAVAGGAAVGAIAAGAANAGTTGKKEYSSNPRYSKGNTVTDDDLEKLSEALFIKDTNNANRFITLNLQKQTTSANTADLSPLPLLNVDSQALQIPTVQKVLSIYDNYKLDSRIGEYISPAQRTEESLLVDTFLSTNVMAAAMRFLADKNVIRKDYYEYKDTLRRLWFNLYSRGGDGKIGSAGFEHVFLTEHKLGTEVSGLHNWIYFNAEEVAKRADYLGYIKKVDLGDKAAIVKIHVKHSNLDKPVTTLFIGTSPELEMALYTVCFLTRPEQPCPVSLGGTKFNIITHKFRYRGNDLIGSAYPDI